jgi:SAM-dependent methyltransferase
VSLPAGSDGKGLRQVRDFWNEAACGERYAAGESARERLDAQARTRYALEPFIHDFARFAEGSGADVLEVGVGMGADHLEWARSRPRSLTGIDLTPRAIDLTRQRLGLNGFASRLLGADAEHLPFRDASFDTVYSWGVIHHSPDTAAAAREIHRVLRPGGRARVMVYHSRSLVGAMLWLRYALLVGHPWRSLEEIYSRHLESPGTKAYSLDGARRLFESYSDVTVSTQLGPGDLLEGGVGERHRSAWLAIARRLFPRGAVRRWLPGHGLYLLIDARRRG